MVSVVGQPNCDVKDVLSTLPTRIRFLHRPPEGIPIQGFDVADQGDLGISLGDDEKGLFDNSFYRHS